MANNRLTIPILGEVELSSLWARIKQLLGWSNGKVSADIIPTIPQSKVENLSTSLGSKQDKITSTNKLAYSLISGTPTSLPANGGSATNATYIVDGDNKYSFNDISGISQTLSGHTGNTSNPHSVTKSQVGLGNVENKSSATIRGEITSSNVTTALGYTPLNSTLKGAASGLAELDANGKVPSTQLPSYVDDVLEYTNKASFPTTGETGKIYVDKTTNLTWRWSGSAYVEISPSLALGETSSTAYRGDRGKTAYDHSQATHARTDATKTEASSTNGKIKINGTETTVYTHPASHAASMITGLATVATSGSYNDLSNKPTIPTNTNQLTNGAGFTTNKGTVTSVGINQVTYTPDANGAVNVTQYFAEWDHGHDAATTEADGFMSSADKTKLNGIATGATAVSSSTVSGWGFTKNTGTVTSVKVGTASYSPVSGVVSLPAYPTTLPASDVSSWAKAANKPSYSFSEITSRGEAYLGWGGRNFSGGFGPIDACLVPRLGANRLAYLPAGNISVKYTRDGGTTWTDYGATNESKRGLTTVDCGGWIIGNGAKGITNSNYQLKVVLSSVGSCYTVLNKFVIYVSTNGSAGTTVTIRVRKRSEKEAGNDTWDTIASNIGISGWSGYNVVNVTPFTFYGNSSFKTTQYDDIEFTFKQTSCSSSYNGLTLYSIFGYGGVGWSTPSNLARDGHMYYYDANQNVTFPANLSATTFIGALSGNATTATTATDYAATGGIATALSGKQASITSSNKLSASLVSGLATVATSGSYNDLSNKPTIPTKASWNYDDVYSKLGHTHDDRYYTESEIDTKLSGKQATIDASHKLAYSLISGTPTSLPANGGTSTYASYIGDSDNNYDFNDISGIGQVCDNHIANTNNPHSVTKAQVGLGNVGNFKAVSTVASQGLTATEKSNARANIGAGTSSLTIGTTSTTAAAGNHSHSVATTYSNGYMSASDKSKLDGIGAVSIADIDSLFDGGGGGSGSGGGSGYYYSSSSSSWW